MIRMMKPIKIIKTAAIAVIMIFVTFALPVIAMADANIGMTTSNGTVDVSGDINVTVEITSDDQIGTYYIELEYDSARMRYVSGAEREQDGILTLTGTGMSKTVRYDLKFTGATGGEAGMIVRTALVNDTAGNAVNTTDSGMLSIVVTGQADSSASFVQKLAEEEELFDSELPVSGTIHDADGNVLYVVDLARTTPEIMSFPFELVEEPFEGQIISFAEDKNGTIKMLPLMDADDNVALYAVNGDMFYPMTAHTDANGNKFVYVSLEACSTMPQKIASDTEMWDYAVYAIAHDGTGGFYLINEQGNLELYTVLNATTLSGAGLFSRIFSGSPIPWERYLIIAAGIIILVIILVIILSVLFKSLKNRRIRKVADYQYDYSIEEPVSVDEDISDIDVLGKPEDVEKDAETAPVSKRAQKAKKTGNDNPAGEKKVSKIDDISAIRVRRAAGKPAENEDGSDNSADDCHAHEEIVTVQEQKKIPVPEENAEPDTEDPEHSAEIMEPAAELMEDDREELSLDDIVLTSEDMPEELRRSGAESAASPASSEPSGAEPAAFFESGPKSISASEPDEVPDEMEKTIRIEKIILSDTNSADTENSGNGDDMDDVLKNIEL